MATASKFLYGLHDYADQWAALVQGAAKTGWTVETLELGDNPNDRGGQDFSHMVSKGLTVIGRLNYSHHGAGTIPVPDRYDEFAIRCGNFVRASKGCHIWIIGNEPNISGERPDNNLIQPADYIRCYKLCRDAIKAVSLDHRVMVAAIAPYNDETGWCVDYWRRMLEELTRQGTETDGFPLHTYSRGPSVASISSEDKMGGKYSAYYNGFRAYRDFLAVVPKQMAHLRGYITETDQLEPWADTNSGWVMEAYREINSWNVTLGTIKVDCLALYRWPKYDQWWVVGKNGVIEDFKQTLTTTNFLVQPVSTIPAPPKPASGPTVTVIAPAGANIRSGPGTSYTALGAVPTWSVMPLLGTTVAEDWYQVTSPWGTGWVFADLVEVSTDDPIPVVFNPAPPAIPSKLDSMWLINTLSRVLGIDPKAALATIMIESGGRSFEGDRMIIRFENHVFLDQVAKNNPNKLAQATRYFRYGNPIWTGHQWSEKGDNVWDDQHDDGQPEEWATFNLARKVDETAAMKAISMGSAQILGTNYGNVGFGTVQEMFNAYNDKTTGEFSQLAGFFAYVRAAGLVDAIKDKDWKRFAFSYNGSGQVDYYANAIASKYKELGGR